MIQTKIITSGTSAGNFNLVYYSPDGATGKLPTVVFVPGSGETGTDVTKLYVNGPLYFIQNKGWKPAFNVIAVQPTVSWPPNRLDTPWFMRAVMKEITTGAYNVDISKIYLTGLSYGAAHIYNYIQAETDDQIIYPAAIIPMSMAIYGITGNYNAFPETDALSGNDFRFDKIGFEGFCGTQDTSFLNPMNRYVSLLKDRGDSAFMYSYSGGHCCWNTIYDPTAKFNSLSIYDWALQYSTTNTPPVVTPPPPATKTITKVVIYYSDGTSVTQQ
jgi:poly(3-hydroxybutyrate) depolymerase